MEVIPADDLMLIGHASAALEALADRLAARSWGAQSKALNDKPRAQDLGRVAGLATHASDTLFEIANVARNYAGQLDAIEEFNLAARRWRERYE